MKLIPVTKGRHAIVDDEDYPFLSRFSWQISGSNEDCVSTNFKLQNGRWVRIPMSRFLYVPKIQYVPVYVNKNPLDNQKANIRLITQTEKNGTSGKMYLNTARKGKMKLNPSSKYKGVSRISDPRYTKKLWKGCIQFQGKVHVKSFYTEREAGIWYNGMAKNLFGELAYQNIIVD